MIIVIGKEARFARWLFKVNITQQQKRDLGCARACGQGGIYCFSDHDYRRTEEELAAWGIPFTVQQLEEPAGFKHTQGKRYSSRTEALNHIEKGITPASEEINNLRERLNEAEKWAAAAAYRVQALDEQLKKQRSERSDQDDGAGKA